MCGSGSGAPWDGQGQCPTPPEGPGQGEASFFPVTEVRSCFRGHTWGLLGDDASFEMLHTARSPFPVLHPGADRKSVV